MIRVHPVFVFSIVSLAVTSSFAATPIHLQYQSASFLQTFTTQQQSSIKETSRHTDFNGATHIRIQQMYKGLSIWNGDAIIHVQNGHPANLAHLNNATTLNGTLYQNLNQDLGDVPAYLSSPAQAEKVLQAGLALHQKKTGIKKYDNNHVKKDLIVYVDKENKAHFAYLVSFISALSDGMLAVPTYILDANNFSVYEEWNNLQTATDVTGGGLGGNPKMGKLVYDGLSGDYPAFNIKRSTKKNTCSLKNDDVTVLDDTNASGPFDNAPVAKFKCDTLDSTHNNVYWDGDQDSVNGGYSPVNDAMYAGIVIKDMYQKWYGVPVLSLYGTPLDLNMHAHAKDLYGQPMDNAYFLSLTMQMYFGDGIELFYPLTSLGVGAHELSHGFTSAHSNLTYEKQSGGLNESYSDMAAQAAEFYSIGKNSWQIGPEIVKGNGALRYMDEPTKDGKSISHMKDYNDSLNVHYSSGIFNKAFYLMGSAEGWNTKKAFDVMVKANMDYWTANSTFADAACGVFKATKDYNYDTSTVVSAMKQVGLDVSHC